jgi:hypothetical protein
MMLSPKNWLVLFTMMVAIVLVLSLYLVGVSLPYMAKYLIVAAGIVLYVLMVAIVERLKKKLRVLHSHKRE